MLMIITKNWRCATFSIFDRFSNIEHIKELLTRKMSCKWLQRFLPMHKNHSKSMIQKVFSRCRSTRTSAKIIYKSNCVMLQRHRRSTRLNIDSGKTEKKRKKNTKSKFQISNYKICLRETNHHELFLKCSTCVAVISFCGKIKKATTCPCQFSNKFLTQHTTLFRYRTIGMLYGMPYIDRYHISA